MTGKSEFWPWSVCEICIWEQNLMKKSYTLKFVGIVRYSLLKNKRGKWLILRPPQQSLFDDSGQLNSEQVTETSGVWVYGFRNWLYDRILCNAIYHYMNTIIRANHMPQSKTVLDNKSLTYSYKSILKVFHSAW